MSEFHTYTILDLPAYWLATLSGKNYLVCFKDVALILDSNLEMEK